MHARRVAAVVAVALVPGLAAGPAHAGTASGRPATFTAAAGERNYLAVDAGASGDVRFSDAGAPILPGLGCLPLALGRVTCDPDGDPRDADGGGVGVDLGDRDDRAVVRGIPGTGVRPGAIRVLGGAGDDRIENAARGIVTLDGGDGDDTLVTGPTPVAYLLGGAGADLMVAAGRNGVASYADHDAGGVRVTLDAIADDGAPGEGDDVRTSAVVGSPGPDVITGDAGANTLTGGAGADRLDGRAGDDTIHAARLAGLSVDDEGADAIVCGTGTDDVQAGRSDTFGVDCERVSVDGGAGPELVLASISARATRAGVVRVTYRLEVPEPANALMSRSAFRLVDRAGRPASSTARFVLGDTASVARIRVKLDRATRRRLARSAAGALTLVAQRTSTAFSSGIAYSGYEQHNTAVRVRRAGRS